MSQSRKNSQKIPKKLGLNIIKDVKNSSESTTSSSLDDQTRHIIHPKLRNLEYHDARSMVEQEHGRHRIRTSSALSTIGSLSHMSLASGIHDFRNDFDEFKCKMQIFGESLNLCQCMAKDFKGRLLNMEKRLKHLEKKHNFRAESNYSAIIKKNKHLSQKTLTKNPTIKEKLQMCGTEAEMRDVAAEICRNYLHGAWKSIEPSQLQFRRIRYSFKTTHTGGLSNFLYYIALPDDTTKLSYPPREVSPVDSETSETDVVRFLRKTMNRSNSFTMDEPRKVLLRIYGQVHGERAMDAIVTESVIFTLLSERKLGPKLHGVFSGGRIEEYIPARPLLTKELSEPALSMKIAEKMAAIHSMDVPLSKEPNWLWKSMGKWLKTVNTEKLLSNTTAKNETEEKIMKRLENIDFEKEIEWLKKFIATVESPVVFCHNDMQEGNILMLEEDRQAEDIETEYYTEIRSSKENNHTYAIDEVTNDSLSSHISDSGEPKLVLIDFEYCAYNYRGFDIANHFQEWVYDYTNPEYPFYHEFLDSSPTLEQKEIFIKEYLKHCSLIHDDKEQEPSIDAVNHLLNEVDAFALASHLFWTLWSIVNASKSKIPFGYWEYSISRLETYLRLKQEVIKKDKFGFPQKRKIEEVDI